MEVSATVHCTNGTTFLKKAKSAFNCSTQPNAMQDVAGWKAEADNGFGQRNWGECALKQRQYDEESCVHLFKGNRSEKSRMLGRTVADAFLWYGRLGRRGRLGVGSRVGADSMDSIRWS